MFALRMLMGRMIAKSDQHNRCEVSPEVKSKAGLSDRFSAKSIVTLHGTILQTVAFCVGRSKQITVLKQHPNPARGAGEC